MSTKTGLIVTKQLVYETIGATPEEMSTLENLKMLRNRVLEELDRPQNIYGLPSTIIEDFLFHGDLGHACSLPVLLDIGINAIVNVCDCLVDDEVNINLEVLWKPIDDAIYVDIRSLFEETNDFIEKVRQNNKKVLVNCQMGISRSSAIVLAYLMKHKNMSLAKAYEYLLKRRRIVNPNPGFMLQLLRYENDLKSTMAQSPNENINTDEKKPENSSTTPSGNEENETSDAQQENSDSSTTAKSSIQEPEQSPEETPSSAQTDHEQSILNPEGNPLENSNTAQF